MTTVVTAPPPPLVLLLDDDASSADGATLGALERTAKGRAVGSLDCRDGAVVTAALGVGVGVIGAFVLVATETIDGTVDGAAIASPQTIPM
jgi:hypothetical protein